MLYISKKMYSMGLVMAGVIKRNNKWVAVFRTLEGKEVRKSTGIDVVPRVVMPGQNKKSIASQNEARARLIAEEMEKQCRYGVFDKEKVRGIAGGDHGVVKRFSGGGGESVRGYLGDWLKKRGAGSVRAWERDRVPVERFLLFLGDSVEMDLGGVKRGMVADWVEAELERVSAGTVGRYVKSLSSAFSAAVERELITVNPFKGMGPTAAMREKEAAEKEAFSLDEVQRMLREFPGEWPDMIRVCLYTGGQRLGDVATLRWEQVKFDGGLIAMTAQKTKRRMNKPLIDPLRVVLERRQEVRVNEFVFPLAAMKYEQAGGKVSKLSLEFAGLLRRYGVLSDEEGVELRGDRRRMSVKSFHSLRATAVTVLRLAGVPADLCRFIVGHDSEEIERVYFRPDGEAIKDAMRHLEF